MWVTILNILFVSLIAISFAMVASQSHGEDLQAAIQLMKQGQKLIDQARYREAIDVFKKMETSCGSNDECNAAALFWIGRSYLELSLYKEAEHFVDRAQEKFGAMRKPLEEASALYLKARILQGRNDYSSALDFYNQAEDLFKRHGKADNLEMLYLLVNRARLYIYQSQYERALHDVSTARKLLGARANPQIRGLLAECEGLTASEKGQYPQAIKLFDEAIRFHREAGNRPAECATLNKRGRAYESLGEYSKALTDYESSVNVARQFGNKAEEAFAWNNIGMVHRKRGNYEKSLKAYDTALKLRSPDAQPQFYTETLANRAWASYLVKSDAREAVNTFRDCLKAAERAGAVGTQARVLHNLALVMKDKGQFKESRELSQKAIQIARQIGQKRFEAQAILRLGNLYEYYGGFDDALKQYTAAEKIQRDVGDQFFRSTTLVDIANMETRLGQIEDAKGHFEEALKLRKKIGVPIIETLCNMSLFLLEKYRYLSKGHEQRPSPKDYRQAWTYLEQAQKEIDPNVSQDKLLVDYAIGRYLLDKDPRKAVTKFQNLVTAAHQANRLRYQFLAHFGLGKAYESLEQRADAEKAYQAAVDLAEKVRETLDREAQMTFLDGEPILGVKYALAYEGLARIRLLQGNWDGALQASEYTKARAFADKLARIFAGSSFGIDPQLLSQLNEVEKQIRANSKRIEQCQAREGDKSQIPKLESEKNRLDGRLKDIKNKIKARYPDFYATRFPTPLSIRQANLSPDKLLLVYKVTDTGFMVFVCKGEQILYAEFDPTPRLTLDRKIENYREPLEEPGTYDELKKLNLFEGRALGHLLLKDRVRKYLEPGRPVVIVPDDCLEKLPFEMLIMDKGGEISLREGIPQAEGVAFFGDRNPLTYYQSLTALNLVRKSGKPKATHGKVLVIADVIVPSEAPQQGGMEDASSLRASSELIETMAMSQDSTGGSGLRFLSAETYLNLMKAKFEHQPKTATLAKAARDLFGTRAVVMERDQATLKKFQTTIAPNIKDFSLVVFATHGYFGDEFKPEIQEPFLLMSCLPPRADNLLRMSAVMDLDLRADNVMLVACQTGRGRYIAGEGTMGMGRAFQYAGAKSVLVSLWSVDEEPSVKLVQRFLEEQAKGKGTVEALKNARRHVREQGYDHPFFWSSFILVGESGTN